MTILLVQQTFEADSGLPSDASVNTFHVDVPAVTAPTLSAVDLVFGATMYTDTAVGASGPVCAWLSSNRNGVLKTKIYDLSTPPPRVPVFINSRTYTPGSQWLPSEVALVLSFQADPVSGTPQARRRNRIYLGPLHAGALGSSPDRPNVNTTGDLAAAATAVLAASDTSPLWTWVAYSATFGTFAPVTNGWVDNAFDTQRRRGSAPSSRILWS